MGAFVRHVGEKADKAQGDDKTKSAFSFFF
jgi:hypothetical protein